MNKIYFSEVVLLTKSYNLQDFKDWLHWHLDIIGFDHAHIFDNESIVDIKTVCDSYGSRVSYEKIIGWPNQYCLYNRYINNQSKAWWVLPIDDDEFLYVSDKYNHKINDLLLDLNRLHNDWFKVSVGWRNLFPSKYTEERTNQHMVLNATGWSDQASEIWQAGNRPVKTFVRTTHKFEWSDRIGHSTHDPLVNGQYQPSRTFEGKPVRNSWQLTPTDGNSAMILYHYQFRSNKEWEYKCSKRVSAGAKGWNKNYPDLYKKLYLIGNSEDNRMAKIWNG